MARRTRVLRYLAWTGAGAVAGALLAVLLLYLVARTERGHKWVLTRTLAALGKGINGTLEIDRISGNLFRGAKLYGIALRDAGGEPFVLADSAFLEYDVATLITPRIVINRATVYHAEVFVSKMPGDSLWNYQELFADTTPRDPDLPRVERLVILDRVRVVDASARVQLPWAPDDELPPAARRREVSQMLADTAPLLVDSVPGGYVRTMSFRGLYGGFSSIQFAPGSEAGSRFGIDSLRGTAQVYRDTALITGMRGQLALLKDRVEFDSPVLRLPGSRLAVSGVVRFEEGSPDPLYDLAFRGDTVRFADLRWLYPRFPRDAVGQGTLLIESRPEGTLFLVRDAAMRAPGTRIAGSFGMVLGDSLLFTEVDVEARPLRVQFIEQMLPEGLPVRGLRLGGVEITGSGQERESDAEAEPRTARRPSPPAPSPDSGRGGRGGENRLAGGTRQPKERGADGAIRLKLGEGRCGSTDARFHRLRAGAVGR